MDTDHVRYNLEIMIMGTDKLLICMFLFCLSQCQLYQEQLQKSLESGRSHYEKYQIEASKDECWRTAVSSLNQTCRNLGQTAQQRLAIAFANCHWLSAERRTYKCTDDMSIASCTSEMTDAAFDVYTQFFNHLEDACFYLQSHLWQEKTERLITDLSYTSEEAVAKVTESLRQHEILQKGQEQSLSNQDKLIKNGQELHDQLNSTREDVSKAFSTIQQQALSFKEQFNEIFISLSDGIDRVHTVLTWLLGEFINIERFVVFIVGMVIAYLLTCSKYTAQARPILMMTVIAESVFLERCIVNWYLSGSGDNTTVVMEGLHFILWIIRYLTTFICFLLLMYFYMTYRNFEVVNYELLQKIIEQNRQIKRHLKLETEEDPNVSSIIEESHFIPKTSTPKVMGPIINEVAIIPNPTVSQVPFQSEIGIPRHDSVDYDQPDSGIDEAFENKFTSGNTNKEDTTKRRYNLRSRCNKRQSNKILESESPEQFARVVYQSEQLTRLRHSLNSSSKMTPCSATRRHS